MSRANSKYEHETSWLVGIFLSKNKKKSINSYQVKFHEFYYYFFENIHVPYIHTDRYFIHIGV